MTDTALWVLSKLVWAAIRPETLLLLLLVAAYGTLCRGRLRLAGWSLGLATLGFLVVAVFPLGGSSWHRWSAPSRPARR